MKIKKYRLVVFILSLLFILGGGIITTLLAKGYKIDFSRKKIQPTGLLVATSVPDGASVFVDGKLKTATNATLNLPPGEYEIEIKKDGYFPWKKKLKIKEELVVKTDAYLFSNFPDLRALTFTGAANPLLSPDGSKVVYAVANENLSLSKQGLWVLDLTDRPLGLSREPRQIIANTPNYDFSQAKITWSPDSKQILVTLNLGKGKTVNFLLDSEKFNPPTVLTNITPTLSFLEENWEKEREIRLQAQLSKLQPEVLRVISQNAKEIQFSPDETKIMYTATASASIPSGLIPLPPVVSTQTEEREIKPSRVYVYDLKEDKNFFISEAPNPKNPSFTLSWFPTSKHILIVQKDKISIKEYDGTNTTDIYSGPFINSFAFPFPAGNRLLILTALGKNTPPNLYAVSLR